MIKILLIIKIIKMILTIKVILLITIIITIIIKCYYRMAERASARCCEVSIYDSEMAYSSFNV